MLHSCTKIWHLVSYQTQQDKEAVWKGQVHYKIQSYSSMRFASTLAILQSSWPCAHRVHIPGLLWDLARDLVGPHGVIRSGLLVAEVGTNEDEGHRDAKPQEAQGKQGSEWSCTRGVLAPDHQVEHEEDAEDDAGEQQGCLNGSMLPLLTLHASCIQLAMWQLGVWTFPKLCQAGPLLIRRPHDAEYSSIPFQLGLEPCHDDRPSKLFQGY